MIRWLKTKTIFKLDNVLSYSSVILISIFLHSWKSFLVHNSLHVSKSSNMWSHSPFEAVSVSQPDVGWGSSWSLLDQESWLYLVQNSNHAKVPTCEIILRCSEKAARWRLGLLLISPGSPPALGAVGPVLHCKLGWEKKSTNFVHQTYFIINHIQGCKTFGCLAAIKWRENEKMKRKLRENEEMEKE